MAKPFLHLGLILNNSFERAEDQVAGPEEASEIPKDALPLGPTKQRVLAVSAVGITDRFSLSHSEQPL